VDRKLCNISFSSFPCFGRIVFTIILNFSKEYPRLESELVQFIPYNESDYSGSLRTAKGGWENVIYDFVEKVKISNGYEPPFVSARLSSEIH
jgi:hypothetical protein